MLGVVFVNEYVRRVKTKTFVLTTLLVPLAVVGIIGLVGGLISHSVESESERIRQDGIAVLDETGQAMSALREAAAADGEEYRLVEVFGPVERAKQAVLEGRQQALVVLPRGLVEGNPAAPIAVYVKTKQSVLTERAWRSLILGAVRELRLARHELPPEALATLRERLAFDVIEVSEEGERQGSIETSGAIGTAIAMAIFLFATIYGGSVMQAVMEEKSSRMAEIIVASVGAFELLLGKILAVSAMAATQVGAWLLLLLVGGVALGVAVGFSGFEGAVGTGAGEQAADQLPFDLPAVRWDVALLVVLMLPLGYLINASLFAALGAMHENPWEAQMSVTVAMLPMLLAIIVAQTMVFAPNGPLVAFGSFFPFTAPAILPARMLLADMPVWQVALSVALTVATTVGMVWLCGRIFRGSLLIYGKKLTWRELRQVIVAD